MSFNPEMLRSRLVGTTEAADSITSTAHWILFHKRNATTIAENWADAVATDENKLPEIYVANEVIQQSKIKHRPEFVDAFSAVLPSALSKAYLQSDLPTRDRIVRVVRVWRDRSIFTPQDQEKIEQALKSQGDLLTSSVPPEVVLLVKSFKALKAASEKDGSVPQRIVDEAYMELENVHKRIDNLVAAQPRKSEQGVNDELASPEVEPLPAVDVYTAQDAKQSLENTAHSGNSDDEVGYAASDEDEAASSLPAEKKQKVDAVDPQIASFLANYTSNSEKN